MVQAVEDKGRSFVHDSGRRLFQSPAFVLKVGNSLLKCAQLKQGCALRNGDDVTMKEAEDFVMLHSTEFTDRVLWHMLLLESREIPLVSIPMNETSKL